MYGGLADAMAALSHGRFEAALVLSRAQQGQVSGDEVSRAIIIELQALAGLKRFDEALTVAELVLKGFAGNPPDRYEQWLLLGVALSGSAQHDQALVAVERAIGTASTPSERQEGTDVRTDLLIRAGRIEEALTELLERRGRDPRDPTYWLYLHIDLEDARVHPEAAAWARKHAIDLGCDATEDQLQLLTELRTRGAAAVIEGARTLPEPVRGDAGILTVLTLANFLAGNETSALMAALRAMAEPPGVFMTSILATTLQQLGKFEQALEVLDRVLVQQPERPAWLLTARNDLLDQRTAAHTTWLGID